MAEFSGVPVPDALHLTQEALRRYANWEKTVLGGATAAPRQPGLLEMLMLSKDIANAMVTRKSVILREISDSAVHPASLFIVVYGADENIDKKGSNAIKGSREVTETGTHGQRQSGDRGGGKGNRRERTRKFRAAKDLDRDLVVALRNPRHLIHRCCLYCTVLYCTVLCCAILLQVLP